MKTVKLTPSEARAISGLLQERLQANRTLDALVSVVFGNAYISVGHMDRWEMAEADGQPVLNLHVAAAAGATNE